MEVGNIETNPLSIDREITLYQPLIPNLTVIRLSPETDLNF
jgi:hypothetical protein